MNTVLLQYAVEVEKTGSITQAANNLCMEQPNLSKAIKALEESLGAPIFKRTPKGVVPTPRGRVFLEYSRRVLAQIEEMEALYRPENTGQTEFRLSIPRASYISHAFSLFVAGLDRKGGMSVWLRETNTMNTLRDVESGEYRLGILRYPAAHERYYLQMAADRGLEAAPVWEYECLVLMSARHPLAGQRSVSAPELESYTEITHGDLTMPAALKGDVKSARTARGLSNRIYIYERGSQFDLLQADASAYMWVSPLPREMLRRHGLVQVSCPEGGKYRDTLVYGRGCRMTEWDKKFIQVLEDVKNEVLRSLQKC